jgi:hypothetical protein
MTETVETKTAKPGVDIVERVRTASSPAAAAASFTEPKVKRGKAAHDAETGEVTGEMSEDEMADIRRQEAAQQQEMI